MTLVTDRPAQLATGAHRLAPMVEVERKKRKTVGWQCQNCGTTWPELPPVPERLTGCT